MIGPAWASIEPRLADHRSQAARTATLPTAPPRQALDVVKTVQTFSVSGQSISCVSKIRYLGFYVSSRSDWQAKALCSQPVRLFVLPSVRASVRSSVHASVQCVKANIIILLALCRPPYTEVALCIVLRPSVCLTVVCPVEVHNSRVDEIIIKKSKMINYFLTNITHNMIFKIKRAKIKIVRSREMTTTDERTVTIVILIVLSLSAACRQVSLDCGQDQVSKLHTLLSVSWACPGVDHRKFLCIQFLHEKRISLIRDKRLKTKVAGQTGNVPYHTTADERTVDATLHCCEIMLPL